MQSMKGHSNFTDPSNMAV